MTQKAWIRFTGPTLNLIGRVDVPAQCPPWFKETLSGLSTNRELTMTDVSPSMWLDSCIQRGLPIYLYKPLLLQSTVEKIYVLKEEINKTITEKDGKKVVDQALVSKCLTKIFTREDIERLTAEKSPELPAANKLVAINPGVIGLPNTETQVPVPVLDYTTDQVDTFRVLPTAIFMYTEVKNNEYFEDMAEEVYAGQVESVRSSVLPGPGFNG